MTAGLEKRITPPVPPGPGGVDPVPRYSQPSPRGRYAGRCARSISIRRLKLTISGWIFSGHAAGAAPEVHAPGVAAHFDFVVV